jgi:hypothetical protein
VWGKERKRERERERERKIEKYSKKRLNAWGKTLIKISVH